MNMLTIVYQPRRNLRGKFQLAWHTVHKFWQTAGSVAAKPDGNPDVSLNPFHPANKLFFIHLLKIFRVIFQFLRPKLDCYVKFLSWST